MNQREGQAGVQWARRGHWGTSLEDERPHWGREVISRRMRWACPGRQLCSGRGSPGLEPGRQRDRGGDRDSGQSGWREEGQEAQRGVGAVRSAPMALPAHPPAHALRSETLLPFPDADFLFFPFPCCSFNYF